MNEKLIEMLEILISDEIRKDNKLFLNIRGKNVLSIYSCLILFFL